MSEALDLDAWLREQRLVVCVGSGGVGKTTTAAAIGLRAAVQGRKAMVLTIDPAKRLANSLGLEAMGGEPTRIALEALPEAKGELWAMMLDSRGTFDALIAQLAPSPEARDRILANHVYKAMSATFAGSQDYMATEKLHDLVASGGWDLVVLDTPPVKNALDFLEAPGRVVSFLDERVMSWFLGSSERRGLAGLFAGTQAFLFRLLGMVFGSEFLDDLRVFLNDFQGLYAGFRERHTAVMKLFRAEGTSFVVVCAPTEASADVARFFEVELRTRTLPRAGLVVNQVHVCEASTDDARVVLGEVITPLAADLPPQTVNALLARLGRAHGRLRELVLAERAVAASVRAETRGVGWYQEVPRIEGEVHDLPSLAAVGRFLFGRPGQRA